MIFNKQLNKKRGSDMLFNDLCNQAKIDADSLLKVQDRISLLGALDELQVERLYSYMEHKTFAPGDVVFCQGDMPSDIFILYSGQVHLTIFKHDDSVTTMDFYPGDCLGETSVIGIQPQIGDAVATKKTKALVLSKHSLLELLEEDTQLFGILMMNVAREVSRRLHTSLLTEINPHFRPLVAH